MVRGFYTGTLHQIKLEAAWAPSSLVTLLMNVEHDIGRLEQGDFDLTLVGTKVRMNLSPDLQFNSLLQYDIEDRWQVESNQFLVKVQYKFRG